MAECALIFYRTEIRLFLAGAGDRVLDVVGGGGLDSLGGSGGLGGLGGSCSKYPKVSHEMQDQIDEEMPNIYELVRKFAEQPPDKTFHTILYRVSF